MSLGQIPAGNLRAYYKLENVNDSSGNGFTLTNNNSVAFNPAKFSSGADFGTSGTNKSLSRASSVLTADLPSNLAIFLWFKLNDITTNNANAIIMQMLTGTTDANGNQLNIYYNIVGANLVISCKIAGATIGTLTITADYEWHLLQCVLFSSGTAMNFRIVDKNVSVDVFRSTFSGSSFRFRIGGFLTTNQAFMAFDEIIISENLYTQHTTSNSPEGLSERTKYYTQAKGRFCI